MTLIKNLLLIRPFVCLLATFVGKNDRLYNSLFVIRSIKLNAYLIRAVFRRLFNKYSDISISFSDYRQVASYLARLLNITAVQGN